MLIRLPDVKRIYYIVPALATMVFGWFYYRSEMADRREREAWLAPRPDQDLTDGSDGICEIHRVQMIRERVDIEYGLDADSSWFAPKVKHAGGSENFLAIQKSRFPHALDRAFGGCVITSSSPRKAVIYVCPECANNLAAWQQNTKATQTTEPAPGGE